MHRHLLLASILVLTFFHCGGDEKKPVAPTPSASPVDSSAPTTTTTTADAGAPVSSASASAAPVDAGPPPKPLVVCQDPGQRLRITTSLTGCGLKLGKSNTLEQPGVVRLVISYKSTCNKTPAPIDTELSTAPISQNRFTLFVEGDDGKEIGSATVSMGSAPPCKK